MRLELLFPFTKTTITSLKDMVRNHYHAAFGNEPKMKDVMKKCASLIVLIMVTQYQTYLQSLNYGDANMYSSFQYFSIHS